MRLLSIAEQELDNETLQLIPEIVFAKKILSQPSNEKKIRLLYECGNRSLFLWHTINKIIPSYAAITYHELIHCFFNIHHNADNVKGDENTYDHSLFFKLLHRFVAFFDIACVNVNLLANSVEYTLPTLLPQSENLVFFVENMHIPAQCDKQENIIYNSFLLGGGNPHNMLVTGPVGSGKTYLIKNCILVLHCANCGIVPASKATFTLVNNVFQSLSHIYTHLRGKISKNMGECLFIEQTYVTILNNPGKYIIFFDEFFNRRQE